jgi:3-phenylpropionate/trans-cinnamate dioxygenase ferredoxin subunit
MAEFARVAGAEEVPVGTRKRFFLDDQPLVLFNVDGQYFCIADVCTHDGGPLGEGELYDHEIECPRHGALFDVRTGAALTFPATVPTAVYEVRVEGADILIALG